MTGCPSKWLPGLAFALKGKGIASSGGCCGVLLGGKTRPQELSQCRVLLEVWLEEGMCLVRTDPGLLRRYQRTNSPRVFIDSFKVTPG